MGLQPVADLTATVQNMQNIMTALDERLSQVDDLLNGFEATAQVIQSADISAVAAQCQRNAANITALDERVALIESTQIFAAGASSAMVSSGLHPTQTKSLYELYKDDLVLLLMLASNLALVAHIIFSRKSNEAVKYTNVQLFSGDEETPPPENQDLL